MDTQSHLRLWEPHLLRLEALRGSPVVAYIGTINDGALSILYDYLKGKGKVSKLSLILSTAGGQVVSARKIALTLRDFVEHLTIMVPHRAWSAGTLLALSANELVLGPLAEFSPLDPHLNATGETLQGVPQMISSEDIRMFTEMANKWFGVHREEDNLQLLALVAQRIFPTTLASFYRSDLLTYGIALELLQYQLPNATNDQRHHIAESLGKKYNSHEYPLLRNDVSALGLSVAARLPDQEDLMWDVYSKLRVSMGNAASDNVRSIFAASDYFAKEVYKQTEHPNDGRLDKSFSVEVFWEVVSKDRSYVIYG